MIKVHIKEDLSIGRLGFKIKGHANFSEQGTDIVCAGVSALAIATVNSLEYHDVRFLKKRINEGQVEVIIQMPEDEVSVAVVSALIETFRLGIASMEEDYGKYVRFIDERDT